MKASRDCVKVKPRTRRVAVILLCAGTVVLLLEQSSDREWWPSWPAIGDWLSQWWPLLLAMVLAGTAIILTIRGITRRPATTSASVRWESEPGRLGLVARTTLLAGEAPVARRWNWTAITSVVTTATALGALGFTAQSLSATREQIRLSEQGQVTDRYTKAIDQLGTQGAEHLQTRLGGIYALERLTYDSPGDEPTIIEILSAFVRSSLPAATRALDGTMHCPRSPNTIELAADIQVALTVVGRLDQRHESTTHTDLHTVCLDGANLAGVYLDDADLAGVHLTGAHLTEAFLDNADLTGADLENADLTHAHLSGASLSGASLAGAHLDGAYLTHAQLDRADLTGAHLSGAHLILANLIFADLSGADLTLANLSGADLDSAIHDNKTLTGGATRYKAVGAWW